jgi:hypothetical protein
MRAYDEALHLFNDETLIAYWRQQLARMVEDGQVAAQVAGLSLRRLHDSRVWDIEKVSSAFSLHIRGQTPPRGGAFLENFLMSGSEVLLQDQPLLQLLDEWICSLTDNDFIESLPLLRRSFSGFDAVARRRLMERVARGARETTHAGQTLVSSSKAFERALPLLYQILGIEAEPGGHA